MDTDVPSAGEPPLARICGIQFGLLTSSDIFKLSVYSTDNPVTKPRELADPKLGLPIAKGTCGTCNGGNVDQCQGHFGHCLLPTPIFHPNHVNKLVTVLRKVCLNCGQPKKKKIGKLPSLLAPALKKQLAENSSTPYLGENGWTPKKSPKRDRAPPTPTVDEGSNDEEDDFNCSLSSKHKRKFPEAFIDVEAREGKGAQEASESVIVLSSDEEDMSSSGRKQTKVQSEVDEEDQVEKASTSTVRRSLRKRKSPTDSNGNNSTTESFIDLTHVETWNPLSVAKGGKRLRNGKGKASHPSVEVVEDMFLASPVEKDSRPARGQCKYCSGAHSDRYPEVQLKVEVKEKAKDENLSKAIRMEYKVKQKDIDSVAPDYWSFVEGKSLSSRHPILVKRSRLLLPSEALTILRKIPEAVLARLGMDAKVARPEALIIECVPVPPNCTRIQDDAFGSSNIGFKQGIDRATLIFSKLLHKISSIKKSRFGRPAFAAATIEASELQSIFGLYLREKGAAKAVPGMEKKRIDHVGRVQKRDSRWSLEWLKRHVLGKRSGYSARNVLTGDPFLRVEEIGIPQLVAKYVTIPERVNNLNMEKLQECVTIGQTLTGRYRACGAVRLQRGGDRLEVTRKTSHDLQIGDIVHRHLKDGDLVYVNRPPSLHKHSLLALRVHIQDLSVFTINPAICAPLHADFDGDCLHLFVPQSEEARAELHQLMTVPEQILPSPDGKTIIGMSQDNILATHLMTSTSVFLNKEAMDQMAMWTTRRLPIPAIVKSPAGVPVWTGKQVIDLTIPKEFSFTGDDGADIQDGELVSCRGNWLTSTNGLMRALAQRSPQAAVDHLDCSQSALREWLLSRGFSLSLRDFHAAPDHKLHGKMMDKLMGSLDAAERVAVRQSERDREAAGDPKVAELLEDVTVGYFQRQFREMGETLESKISEDNQLLAMVRSGSKGSSAKVFQQIGCLGLQLSKGDHLLSLAGNTKLSSLAASMSCEKTWQAQGLVKSSLVDGLNPLEFYLHSISVRAGLLRQSLEVTEPGELFKNLMLFLRDLHVSYDGTVRNKCGLEIIQFSYDDSKLKPSKSSEDTSAREESVMPGEAVGILAATAIAQPAYQVMLEANHNVGSKKIRPLALLQDTLFPRSGTKLKASDRRSILRLKPCSCNNNHCEERRALYLKDELQPVSVEMVASAISIQYVPENSFEGNACRADGVNLRLPWVGHIQFDKIAMIQKNVSMERIINLLEDAFKTKSYAKLMMSSFLGSPIFFCRNVCDGMGAEFGPCLHFSASLKSRTSKRMAFRSSKRVSEFVHALRDVMVPLVLKTIVKGDERVESAKIIWEDAAWSPSGGSDDGELVVEVTVQEKLTTSRGSPWSIIKEAGSLIDVIDWRRSAPYSVQEVRHCLGVEAARDCILQRLTLATQAAGTSVNKIHLKLVSDLMVHSGEVNGITPFGYRDRMRSLKTSAPFTAGAFRAPIKTFMEAGEKGDEEFLSGVLAASIFGKRVPVGTGADFTLHLRPRVVLDPVQLQSMDIMDCLAKVNTTIKDEFPETPIATEVGTKNAGGWANEDDWQEGGNAEDGAWGSNTDAGVTVGGVVSEKWGEAEEGGWGAKSPSAEATNGWGSSPSKNVDGGGWGAEEVEELDVGHQGADLVVEATNVCGSSTPSNVADAGGWGAELEEVDVCQGGADVVVEATNVCGSSTPSTVADAGGWGAKDVDVSHGEEDMLIEATNVCSSNTPLDNADAGGWGAEDPTNEWDVEPSTGNLPDFGAQGDPAFLMDEGVGNEWHSDISLPQEPTIETGWGMTEEIPAPRGDWNSHDSDTLRDSYPVKARKDEQREFRPTGANTIPLGRMRQFGGVTASSTQISAGSDGTLSLVREGGTEAQGEGLGDQGFRDTRSGGAPLDTQTGAFGSSPGRRNDGARYHGQNGGGRGASSIGGSTTRRPLDNRKDSDDWHQILNIAREVREILQNYEPEEKLKDADCAVLMTKVLPHHPSSAAKVGCGVEFLKVANHKTTRPNDRPTKCFFVVRTDGTEDDFSYHKCLQTMAARKNPPLDDLYATGFLSNRVPFDRSARRQTPGRSDSRAFS